MDKLLKMVGIIFVFLVTLGIGYEIGKTPSNQQIQQLNYSKQYVADLHTLANDYSDLNNLCEKKYQTMLKGDVNGAYQLKGQADIIYNQAMQLYSKYQNSVPQ